MVWKYEADKALGPDGFTFAFIKKQWDTIGGDIFLAIKEFKQTRKIDRGCNSLFIILVPKITDPNTLDDFRPISLICCLYKIISKVLFERLKAVIDKVISPTQTTFIKNTTYLMAR